LRSRPAADPIKFTLDIEKLMMNSGNIDMKELISKNRSKSKKKRVKVRKKVKRKKIKEINNL
jgi:hypothetical protein